MKVIYVAGKYRDSRGEYYVRENIRLAEAASIFVWQSGGVPLCPHKNAAFLGGVEGTSDSTWLVGDLELLTRCDAIWAIENWHDSFGAKAEVEFAKSKNIPVLFNRDDVIKFLAD
ncbi:MAG: DUF4406 domain-containing protein [bacterium]|nr:DUF4406 domain-containing protein [bacterium]